MYSTLNASARLDKHLNKLELDIYLFQQIKNELNNYNYLLYDGVILNNNIQIRLFYILSTFNEV